MTSPGTAAMAAPSSLRGAHSSSIGSRKWDESVPPVLRPLIRAYILGYASSVGPRIVTLVLQFISARRQQRRRQRRGDPASDPDAPQLLSDSPPPQESFASSLRRILVSGFDPRRFPAFCAALIGGATMLERVFHRSLPRLFSQLSEAAILRISRVLASFISAWLSLRLLQSKHNNSYTAVERVVEELPDGSSPGLPELKFTRYAGRTLDLTLFAACRAVDVVVGGLWERRRRRRVAAGKWTRIESSICKLIDPSVFAASSALIMWAWFYHPTQLPRSYRKWISTAAAVDVRLIEALRLCRAGQLRYGQDTGPAGRVLQGMCAERGWPLAWGDPAVSVPFPCELVHMGAGGASCELHALSRFARSFRWAIATQLPLNLLVVAARASNRSRRAVKRALLAAFVSAARSSAFLAAFIALFYYGVCLARTRVGPRILALTTLPHTSPSSPAKAKAAKTTIAQRIDSGLCVGTGCLLCGWSVLLERGGAGGTRAANLALFVAPRALGTLLPRRYPLRLQWRETLAFAAAAAVVLPAAREDPRRVRGVLGRILGGVLVP